jgi:hypothetical protein
MGSINGTDLRAAFLSLKPRIEPLEVNGEPTQFHVIAFNGTRRAQWRALVLANEGKECMAEVVALGLCDASGELLFNVKEADDIEKIEALDAQVTQQAALRIYEVSGLRDKSNEQAKKNSETTPS